MNINFISMIRFTNFYLVHFFCLAPGLKQLNSLKKLTKQKRATTIGIPVKSQGRPIMHFMRSETCSNSKRRLTTDSSFKTSSSVQRLLTRLSEYPLSWSKWGFTHGSVDNNLIFLKFMMNDASLQISICFERHNMRKILPCSIVIWIIWCITLPATATGHKSKSSIKMVMQTACSSFPSSEILVAINISDNRKYFNLSSISHHDKSQSVTMRHRWCNSNERSSFDGELSKDTWMNTVYAR